MLKGDNGKLDLWEAGVSTWRSVVSNDVGIWWKRKNFADIADDGELGSRARMHGNAGGASARPQTADGVAAARKWPEAAGLTLRVGGRSCRGLCEAFLAPRVLIKEAAADVEIFVVAGWQGGPFVLGKPLRESDHSAGRRRWPA